MSTWTVSGFTEQRELGRSASGRVAEAVHDGSGQPVAIKYLSPGLADDPAFMRRYRGEARALSELRVPQVVRVHDFVEQPGLGAAVITELVDGVSLREMTERSGPAHPEAALAVLKGTLLALAAAHARGIGHRDCKPENVLADTAGNSKLADFGCAVWHGERRPPAGMPPYLAPELWRGAGESPATDLYAATAVFFYCLAGGPPFTGTAAQLQQQHATAPVPVELVDPPLRRLIMRGMAKDPALRPASAAAFAAELEALAVSAYGPGWEERGRGQLAERAAAVLPLPSRARPAGAHGRAPARGAAGDGRRQLVVIASVAAAGVLVLGGVAAAVTLKDKGPGRTTASLSGTSSPGLPGTPSVSAVAGVTPPVAAVGGITATATATPSSRTASCVTPPPAFTVAGSISASKAETVTYHWARSDGANSVPQTLTFTGPGTKAVQTLSFTPPAASGSGQAVLVVTSPVTTASSPAAYTLTCEAPTTNPTASSTSHPAPATAPASTGGISGQALTLTNNAPTSATVGGTYSGTVSVSSGQGPYTWTPVAQLPTGLVATPEGATLTFSGTLSEGGNFPLQLAVHDSSTPSRSATERLTINITVPLPMPTMMLAAALSNSFLVNLPKPFADTLTVTGGRFPYTWSVTGLPAWLTTATTGNNAQTFSITGTPPAAGTYTYTVTVRDSENPPQSLTNTYTITVNPAQ
jgi:serine/threonine-protein kinase